MKSYLSQRKRQIDRIDERTVMQLTKEEDAIYRGYLDKSEATKPLKSRAKERLLKAVRKSVGTEKPYSLAGELLRYDRNQ